MPALIDLTGQTFNSLTVIERASNDGRNKTQWLCHCSACDSKVILRSDRIKDGRTKTCGCLSKQSQFQVTHGQTRSSTYRSWESMKARCLVPTAANYSNYGGRGISVCRRWLSFAAFLVDMGERPPNTSLGRLDNEGDYEPENCRWESPQQQASNKRNSVYVDLDGQVLTVAEAARTLGESDHRVRRYPERFGCKRVVQ